MKQNIIQMLIIIVIIFFVGSAYYISFGQVGGTTTGGESPPPAPTAPAGSGDSTAETATAIEQFFGGKIKKAKASEIAKWEDAGYTCTYAGDTIEIKSIKGPTSYAIPASIKSKTNTKVHSNQWILGKYTLSDTEIICQKPCPPPPGRECIQPVILNTITLFGTSK